MQIQNLVTNLCKHPLIQKFIIIMAPNILKIDDNSLYKLLILRSPKYYKNIFRGMKESK